MSHFCEIILRTTGPNNPSGSATAFPRSWRVQVIYAYYVGTVSVNTLFE